MLCVTGNERDLDTLARRLERVATHPAHALLRQEVRLDALDPPFEPVFGLLERYAQQLVVCCRPPRQGGRFSGAEAVRLALLQRAAGCGVAHVDVEADCGAAEVDAIRAAGPSQLVLSWHDFAGIPPDLERRVLEMSRRGPAIVKLAVAVSDALELEPLSRLQRRCSQPTLVVGMGLAGLVSRCRYPAFGAPWTYVKADEQEETAPGQLSLARALELGLPQSATAPFFALLGGPQVAHSPGPIVYNALFRRLDRPWSYLPVSSAACAETVTFLRQLGLHGASVTMPHKAAALALAGAGADALSRRAGAANSLRFAGERVEATNSDINGVAEPLRRALAALGGATAARALVLGAGGAARAAVLACQQLGLQVTVAALEDARQIFDADVDCVGWEQRAEPRAELLINATPQSGPGLSPWPEGRALAKRVVFDLAISAGPSALLEQAAREGALAVPAMEMWLAQGAAQMSWLSGEAITVAQLRELLPGPPPAAVTGTAAAETGR